MYMNLYIWILITFTAGIVYLKIQKKTCRYSPVQGYYVLAVHEPAVVDQKMDFR